MLIDFKFENFRSFRKSTIHTMLANSSDQKKENFFEIENSANQKFKILKSSIIYGANASGKSNTIRALFEMLNLIWHKPKVDDELRIFDPFTFNSKSEEEPCSFDFTFLGPSQIKYNYSFSVLFDEIIHEELNYYPNGKTTRLFTRNKKSNSNSIFHKGYLGDSIGKKEMTIFKNQLLLSKFSDDEPHELLTEVYLYFKSYEVINPTSEGHKKFLRRKVDKELFENLELKNKVQQLIKEADTKVNGIDIEKINDEDTNLRFLKNNPFLVFGIHDFFDDESLKGEKSIPLDQESTGTQSLYTLGAKVLSAIQNGSVLIVDELDTSLHPFITKMLVMIFHSEKINTKNAQLIFTTHDVSLLDRDLIRRDQVWITEKNEKGCSELFSLQDFDGLREDSPFEKWYLAGKFGGLPKIKSIDSLFQLDE
ncbi:ATP-binding protein [Dokdonia sp.]|uniref:AAA family ATPase n=1 Tax=Dokdonia sp. TaxID=2024995 RepID=UPI003264332D